MALTDENGGMGTTMLVQPSGGYGGDMFGGNSGWWIILLLLCFGGWNNGGFGGGFGGDGLFPWMNQSNQISGGFRDQMINDNVTSIRDGVYGISNQLCNGFAGVTASVTGAQNALAQQMYTNQIADMERSFSAQTAQSAGMTALQGQLAQCCCDNRLATCQTQNIVQNEGNATRFADANNTRDIIDSQTRNTQAILDKLCALELDGVKNQLAQAQRENIALQNQVNMGAFRESQTAQNALIMQGFANETDALYNRLSSCPIPSTPVYGRTPIFTCNNGCGCGNGAF